MPHKQKIPIFDDISIEFKINYKPDFRDKIASSWPSSIDDSCARKDWNWKPLFDINQTTKLMIQHLKEMTLTMLPFHLIGLRKLVAEKIIRLLVNTSKFKLSNAFPINRGDLRS